MSTAPSIEQLPADRPRTSASPWVRQRNRRSWRRRLLIVAALAGAAAVAAVPAFVDGWWLDVSNPDAPPSAATRFALIFPCWISIVSGLIARDRRPGNPIGTWLLISGLLSPAAFIVGGASPLVAPVSGLAFAAAAGFGAAVPISFPNGRLDGRAPAAIAAVVIVCVLYRAEQVILFNPVKSIPGWTSLNPYYGVVDASVIDRAGVAYAVAGISFLLVFGFWLARRWMALTGPARRSIAPVLAGGLLFVGVSVAQSVIEAFAAPGAFLDAVRVIHTLTFGAIPIGFLAGLLRVHMARTAVADLVVELGDTPEPAVLRRALSVALGDPSLEVVIWSAERRSFIDPEGSAIRDLESMKGSRAVTLLERDGDPLAAIVHDPALLDDPGLVASVATAVRLAVENDRLSREVQAQLAEVKASRTRIVEATDAERRRLERDLHDGAQQRLVALSMTLGRARAQLERAGAATDEPADPGAAELGASLAQAADEARAALNELRELARGIHPAILTQAGLEPALRSLVEKSAVPAVLAGSVSRRLPPGIEAAAYFVVSEALANVAKHSSASSARVSVGLDATYLRLAVSDDGCGGADLSAGRGLRGLRDRVEAIGGSLEMNSPVGGGTELRVVLPSLEMPNER